MNNFADKFDYMESLIDLRKDSLFAKFNLIEEKLIKKLNLFEKKIHQENNYSVHIKAVFEANYKTSNKNIFGNFFDDLI